MKNGNSPDLVVTADDTTLKWLSSLLGCTAEQALTVLVSVSNKGGRAADGKG